MRGEFLNMLRDARQSAGGSLTHASDYMRIGDAEVQFWQPVRKQTFVITYR